MSSSHLGHFSAISLTYIHNKYFGKIFSALCVDVFPELFRIFPNFDISWYMTKYSEVHLKNYLLIHYCSISKLLYNLVGLVDRVLSSDTGGPWIKSRMYPFFQYCDKTSEYSEIYHKQLTSEHFLPYNYRSSTLPHISRNIGRLLRQCGQVNCKKKCPLIWSIEWAEIRTERSTLPSVLGL
jgi:hypothetical protein